MKKVERVGADTSRQRSEKKNKQKPVPSFFFFRKANKRRAGTLYKLKAAVLTRR